MKIINYSKFECPLKNCFYCCSPFSSKEQIIDHFKCVLYEEILLFYDEFEYIQEKAEKAVDGVTDYQEDVGAELEEHTPAHASTKPRKDEKKRASEVQAAQDVGVKGNLDGHDGKAEESLGMESHFQPKRGVPWCLD